MEHHPLTKDPFSAMTAVAGCGNTILSVGIYGTPPAYALRSNDSSVVFSSVGKEQTCWWRARSKSHAVAALSATPGPTAFLMGANSSSRFTSSRTTYAQPR